MSDVPADYAERLNFQELLSRIDRQREEALKFAAEQHKLAAEASKLAAEQAKFAAKQAKLAAEEAKLRRDGSLAPVVVAATLAGVIAGAIATAGARLLPLLRTTGVH